MKKQYETVKMNILLLADDSIRTSIDGENNLEWDKN